MAKSLAASVDKIKARSVGLSDQNIVTIKRWLYVMGGRDPDEANDVIDACKANDDAARYTAAYALQSLLREQPDERRTCRTCKHVRWGDTITEKRTNRKTGEEYEVTYPVQCARCKVYLQFGGDRRFRKYPDPDIERRCPLFSPLPSDFDPRPPQERWPHEGQG